MLTFNDDSNWLKNRIIGVKRVYFIPQEFNNAHGIAVDIGANVGAFPIVNHDKFKKIICIEPSEYSYNECKKNIEFFNNVDVFKFAVGKKSNETIKLKNYKIFNSSGNASTYESDLWDENDFEFVETISFEDIINKFNLVEIDYLKVDCEGGEYDFLMNKNLLNINYLAIEIHIHINEKAKELEEYLNQYFIPISKYGNGVNVNKKITYKNKLL